MLQEDVFTVLCTIAALGNRCHPGVAPDKPTTPYVVYTRIASSPENTLADGQPIQQTRLQVDTYASTYAQAQATAQAVEAAMLGGFAQITLQLEQDLYEAEVKLHRVSQDYSIWHAQP